MRLICRDDEQVIRFRNDGIPFDPVEKYRKELQYESDPEKGLAIKMMMKLAKDVKYTGLYGMNNLIIRI